MTHITADQAAALPVSTKSIYWDSVVFKVEDELFRVPVHGLVESCQVFADILSLPQAAGDDKTNAEGQSDDRPILLEGYDAHDFKALLKFIYPNAENVIKGDFGLTKKEWIGVLKLSTVWLMQKIRCYAIEILSTPCEGRERAALLLSPVEKVLLGREYRVRKWLLQGIAELVQDQSLTLDSIRVLGIETACRIFSMRDQCNPLRSFRPSDRGLHCSLVTLQCGACLSMFYKEGERWHCRECGHVYDRFDPNGVFFADPSQATLEVHQSAYRVRLRPENMHCGRCGKPPLVISNHVCYTCRVGCQGSTFVVDSKTQIDDLVSQEFREEIEEGGDKL